MKKTIFISLAILFMITIGLSGCLFTLATPTITMNGTVVKWDEISNAVSYDVSLTNENDETIVKNTTNLKMNIASYVTVGEWSVKVRAITNSFIRNNSQYSIPIVFNVNDELDTPTNVRVEKNGASIVATWNDVFGASGYNVIIEKGSYSTTITSNYAVKDITESLNEGGMYSISVIATASNYDGQNGTFVSASSETVNYDYIATLSAPTIKSFVKSGSAYNLTWTPVANATAYKVSLLGTEETITTTNTSVNVATIEGGLPAIAKYNGVLDSSKLQVAFVQAIGDGNHNLSSDFSLSKIYYGTSTYNTISMDYFYSNFSNIQSFDFFADNQSELDALWKFAIYYRVGDFHYGTLLSDTQISNAVKNYGEILSISRDYLGNIVYYMPSSPTLTAVTNYYGENSLKEQQDYGIISSFSTVDDNSQYKYTENTLPIQNRSKNMNVYTSEQLFQAVQAGYKPNIVGDCGAKYVWDKACEVICDIVDSSMTDYKKVLAIFDWVCYTNVYDYNVYSYTTKMSTLKNEYYRNGNWTDTDAEDEYNEIEDGLRNYRGYYLEGMFLDNGQAVCDGISKAFALLCGMMDITAYKVNGVVSGGGGHAWNKVALDLSGNDGVKEWYTVDCTWADATNGNKELLTHNYFLIKDSDISGNHTEDWPSKGEDASIIDFDFYTYTKIQGTEYDLYIDSLDEVDCCIDYLLEHYDNFEIKVKIGCQIRVLDRLNNANEWDYQSIGNNAYVVYKK